MPIDYPDIAFCGKAGSGKTTCAEVLAINGYSRVSFAGPIKSIARAVWGRDATVDRGLLQWLGRVIRTRDPEAWLNMAQRTIHDRRRTAAEGVAPRLVVDDLRFPNECQMLKEEGFVIVRIRADRDLRIQRLIANGKLQDEEQLNDASETALDDYWPDHEIFNNDGNEELGRALRAVILKEASRA